MESQIIQFELKASKKLPSGNRKQFSTSFYYNLKFQMLSLKNYTKSFNFFSFNMLYIFILLFFKKVAPF
jgi:hypothetical protein